MAALRRGSVILTAAASRHPAMRAARLGWEAARFLLEPEVGRNQGTQLEVRPNSGWTACWSDCGPHPSRTNYGVGWGSTQAPTCAASLQCLNNQGTYPQAPPVGSTYTGGVAGHLGSNPATWHDVNPNHQTWVYGQGHDYIGSQDRWRYRQVFTRPTTGAIQHPLWLPLRFPILGPQTAPMPMPWPLAATGARPNSPVRHAGYGQQPRTASPSPPQWHRPPKRGEKEKKMTLMSGGALRNVIEQAFEGTEWVGILHEALPKDCQAPRGSTVAVKAMAVYRCAPRLSACKIIEGAINNAIEDKIIGFIGQSSKRVAQRTGKAYGLSGLSKKLGLPLNIPKVNLGC